MSAPAPIRSRPHVRPGSPLTTREAQVLDLASHGYTNSDIGRTLGVTEDTIKSHMRAIHVRLDDRDRAHAVRRGFELGLLEGAKSWWS